MEDITSFLYIKKRYPRASSSKKKMRWTTVLLALCLGSILFNNTKAEQCGWQAGGALCPGGLCCSQWGWCGTTDDYCSPLKRCQSQCSGGSTPSAPPNGVGSIISQALFDQMLLHRNDRACPARNFYTYAAFITATGSIPAFGTTGDLATRQKEVAAFFGQTSRETTGELKRKEVRETC